MSTKPSDLKCEFHNRVARLNEQAALRARNMPEGMDPGQSSETAEELRARIQSTLSTHTPQSTAPNRRFMGLPVIVGTLVVTGCIVWLQSPAEEVASALQATESAQSLFPPQNPAAGSGSSFKTVTPPRD